MANLEERQSVVKRPGASPRKILENEDIEKYLDGLPKASGQLLKKSTKNVWQKRWWEIRGPYLMYWGSENDTGKPSPGKKAKMPRQAIDLRCFAEESILLHEVELLMTSDNGNTFNLRPVHPKHELQMEEWKSNILTQIREYTLKYPTASPPSVTAPRRPTMKAEVIKNLSKTASAQPIDNRNYSEEGELPEKFAIRNIWPQDYEVQVGLGQQVDRHGYYAVLFAKSGSPQRKTTIVRFGEFRSLNEKLTRLNDGKPVADNFPETKSKQAYGFTLNPAEMQQRARSLNSWVGAAIQNEITAAAAKELVNFMKITDFRISPGEEEARILQKKVAELKKN